MQTLVAQRCEKCKRIRIRTEQNKWSGACHVSLSLLQSTYDVTVEDFTCSTCEQQAMQDHIACTAGAVH